MFVHVYKMPNQNNVFLSYHKVSEWLLFNINPSIFQLYHGQNKLIIDDMMVRSTLYYTHMRLVGFY
jgi:hypothetical protein